MRWEDRLEDARRRRALVLAARASTRDQAQRPEEGSSRAEHDLPPPALLLDENMRRDESQPMSGLDGLSFLHRPDDAEAEPVEASTSESVAPKVQPPVPETRDHTRPGLQGPLARVPEIRASRIRASEAGAPVSAPEPGVLRRQVNSSDGPERSRRTAVVAALPALSGMARAKTTRLTGQAAAGFVALRRAGPVPLALAVPVVAVAAVVAVALTRNPGPDLIETLAVTALPAPAGPEVESAWKKPAPFDAGLAGLDGNKLEPPETLTASEPADIPVLLLASAPAALPAPNSQNVTETAEVAPEVAVTEPVIESNDDTAMVIAEADAPAPATATVRVYVPSEAGSAVADSARGWIEGEGASIDAVTEVSFRVSATHVRYYHGDDRAEAERLASLADGEARDFTDASPLPGRGFLELYLAGEGAPAPAPANPPQTVADAFAAVEASLTQADKEIVRIIEDIFN